MVLNFNLARASYRSGRELGEFRKAKSGIHDGTDFFEGFDQGFRGVRLPNERPDETARLAAGPGTCRGEGLLAAGPGTSYRFSPSTCCQETGCTPPFAPPPNVVLWETHMAQLGRSQSTGCTKAVRPDQRITGVEARNVRPWRCRTSTRARLPGTHSHSFGMHMPDGLPGLLFPDRGHMPA